MLSCSQPSGLAEQTLLRGHLEGGVFCHPPFSFWKLSITPHPWEGGWGNTWDGLSRGPVGRQGELAGGQHSSLMSGAGVAVLPSLVGRFGSCMGSATQQVLWLVFWFCFVIFLSCCVLLSL